MLLIANVVLKNTTVRVFMLTVLLTLPLAHQVSALTPKQALDQIQTKATDLGEQWLNIQANDWLEDLGQGRTRVVLEGIENTHPNYSLETIQPLTRFDPEINQLVFMQGSLFSANNQGERRPTLNLGLGQRYLLEDQQSSAGVNLFLDYEGRSGHKRGSLGLEYQRSNFGVNLNRYYPLSDKKIIGEYVEDPLAGYDLNFSGQMPYLPWAKIKGSRYYWDQSKSDDIYGNSLGVAFELSPETILELGQEDDNTMQTQTYAKLSVNLPFDERAKTTEFVIDDQAFRPSTRVNLTQLPWVEREKQIKVEKYRNIAPVFTSASTVTVEENQTQVLTLIATDDQAPVSYRISDGSNGDDGDLFSLDAETAVVSFKTAPDYEVPTDANRDNTYQFSATATDATGLSTTQVIRVAVGDDATDKGVVLSTLALDVSETGNITYTIALKTRPSGNVDVNLTSSNSELVRVSPALLTFSDDVDTWHIPQIVNIDSMADDNEVNEQVVITHKVGTDSNGEEYVGVEIADLQVSVKDSAGVGVEILAPSHTDSTEELPGSEVSILIGLNTQPNAEVTVHLNSDDPTEGIVSPSTLIFTPDDWGIKDAVIKGVDDDVDDGNQVYSISLSSTSTDANYANSNLGKVYVTNEDNDTRGLGFSAIPATIEVTEEQSKSYQVKLTSEPTDTVQLNMVSSNPSAITVTESLTFTADNWNIGQTISLYAVTDSNSDAETVQIQHSASGGDYENMSSSINALTKDITPFSAGSLFKGLIYHTVDSQDSDRTWLDRDLGASRACVTPDDLLCRGHLYQWGRDDDGHEQRNSSTTNIRSANLDQAGHALFVAGQLDWLRDIIDPDGVLRTAAWADGGTNDVCPAGFAVPTLAEWQAEELSTGTRLNLAYGGSRDASGNQVDAGSKMYYWSRSFGANKTPNYAAAVSPSTSGIELAVKGLSVRCIKVE